MRKVLTGLAFVFSCSIHAQQTIIPLYNGIAPGSENSKQKEVEYTQFGGKMVRNVVNPTLTVFLPEEGKATGAAVIVAPGGGFCWLSWENEGTMVGEWLQAHGIAAFVLKYRLADMGQTEEELQKNAGEFMQPIMKLANSTNPEEELLKYPKVAEVIRMATEDGRQAIKYVRSNAAKYKINPVHIGMMGFSAGGIITMGVALHHDAESRPDFIAPIYGFALDNLVVPTDAAPMFFACAADDGLIASKATKLYSAWMSAGKSVEFHVYSKGGHGFGMRKRSMPVDNWIVQFSEWLNIQMPPSQTGGKEVFKNDDVVFHQIDDHTWAGTGHMMANESIYLVEGTNKAVLIDAGTNIKDLDKIVASITKKPVILVATHVHPDHTGKSIDAFPEIFINPADTVNIPQFMPGYKGRIKYLKDGQIIDLGGRMIEVVFTPAHTPGSTTFIDKAAGYGFSGDSFGSGNLLLTGDFSTLLATCQKMSSIMERSGIKILYPGHYFGNNAETRQRVDDMATISRDVLSGKLKGAANPNGMMGLNQIINLYGVRINYSDKSIK